MTGITKYLTEQAAIQTATAQKHTRKTVYKLADGVSRKGRAAHGANICNIVIRQFLGLLYEYDEEADDWPNIDIADGRILIYVPWSFHNHRRMGVATPHADVLRAYILRLQRLFESGKQKEPPVFFFRHHYELNIYDYRNLNAALYYFSKREITPKLYKSLAREAQNKRKTPRKLRAL